MFSPSSVDEDAVGKGYLENYSIRKEFIFGEKPNSKHNSSIKFHKTATSNHNLDYESSTRNRRFNRLDSVFFDDDGADTCSVITMHPFNQPHHNNQILTKPTIGYLTNAYHSTKNKQQTVDFNLNKQPNQQLTSTIKFDKNSFAYIDQNDDGECNKVKLIIFF